MQSGVNLIPMSRVMALKRRVRTRQWVFVCAVYAGALAFAWSATRVVQGGGQSALAAELGQLDHQIAKDDAAAKALQPRLVAAISTLEAGRSVGNQPDWSLLLTLLAEFLGDEAVLSSCELANVTPAAPAVVKTQKTDKAKEKEAEAKAPAARAYRVSLSGLGRSHAGVLGFVRKLEECGLFASVRLIETRPETFGSGAAIGFRVECALSDDAGVKR